MYLILIWKCRACESRDIAVLGTAFPLWGPELTSPQGEMLVQVSKSLTSCDCLSPTATCVWASIPYIEWERHLLPNPDRRSPLLACLMKTFYYVACHQRISLVEPVNPNSSATRADTCISPCRKHDPVHRQPRQPPFPHTHDYPWPWEWSQDVALGEEPWTRWPKRGWPGQQDGFWDLPDETTCHQGKWGGQGRGWEMLF